uniref:Zinc-binding dehydrogenase n=1 Tax=Caenorhabditis tropicalis TaxID=1561998 RepID=A0A1I7UC44_9PELO
MLTYGGMSKQPTQAPIAPFIFKNISLRAFWMMTWIRSHKDENLQELLQKLAGWMKSGEIAPTPMVKRSIEDYKDALIEAQNKFDKKQVFFLKK